MYGFDAISGVINIVTQEGSQQPAADVRVSGDLDYAFSGSYLDNGEPVDRDKVTATGGRIQPGSTTRTSIDLTAPMTYVETDIKGGSANCATAPNGVGDFQYSGVHYRP